MRQMKDSGIEWIGEIPKNWECRKLKTFVKLISKGATPSEMSLESSEKYNVMFVKGENIINGSLSYEKINYITEDDNNKQIRSQLEKDDILFVIAGSIGKCGIVSELLGKTNINQAIAFIRLQDKYMFLNKYLYFYFQSDYSMLYSKLNTVKSALPNLSMEDLGNMYITLPKEKGNIINISAHLDRQCAHIDNIIEKTKASIEEYKKLRQAVITQAVTKGVRGGRPMKDSGYEWISEVPAEWSLIPSKYLFGNSDARKHPDDVQLTASQKHGIISQQEYMELENAKIVFANQGIENWKHVEPNDFIISLRSFQGGLELSEVTGCITWHYIVMKALKQVNYRYYKWLFKSKIYITALQRTCNYIRDGQDLRYSNFIQVPLFEPSLEEQQEISEYLDKKTTEIDTLIAKKEQFLTELESYKKSMIYEYVTGKKEVPTA